MKNPYINNENNQNVVSNNNAQNNAMQNNQSLMPENFNMSGFIKGLAVGGVVAYIMTNPKAQEKLFKAIIKGSELVNAGIEELKERFEDVKAEIDAQK